MIILNKTNSWQVEMVRTFLRTLRWKLHEIIFKSDTPAGKAFDVALILAIVISVIAVMLDSVENLNQKYSHSFKILEWTFTILFSVEYILRIGSSIKPFRYIFSFFGIVDLLATIPTYLSLLFPGGYYFLVIRVLRVLRIFRILKLARYLTEGSRLMTAIYKSRGKIIVFLASVLVLASILGSLMYMIEEGKNGFTSIPRSVYWAIVTLTTVGYGDISPQTSIGQIVASLVMVMGYAILAVPTGIVSAEIARTPPYDRQKTLPGCPSCHHTGHDQDASFCKFCGSSL